METRELMNNAEAAEWLGITPRALDARRFRGEGPPYFKLGHLVRYRRSTVLDWIIQQEQQTREGKAA